MHRQCHASKGFVVVYFVLLHEREVEDFWLADRTSDCIRKVFVPEQL